VRAAPNILCPIDFSEASRGALRYASAIAEHLHGGLTIATVNDPLLSDAADMSVGAGYLADVASREMQRFFHETFAGRAPALAHVKFEVADGKPAPEILRVAARTAPDAIVMASHGATGVRKMFFGSTAERVLRETTVPVVVTPGTDPGPASPDDIRKAVRHVLVPVDLTGAMSDHVRVAAAVAETLGATLLLVHVVEPVRSALPGYRTRANVDAERRHRAEGALQELVDAQPAAVKAEALVAFGEPAEEIAKVAAGRNAGLIVIGLQASPLLGPHMGSVTFRVLCLARVLVVALPPPVLRQNPLEPVLQEKPVWPAPSPPGPTSAA
jgi:nucleotide-binding universal stress UspA family protein